MGLLLGSAVFSSSTPTYPFDLAANDAQLIDFVILDVEFHQAQVQEEAHLGAASPVAGKMGSDNPL